MPFCVEAVFGRVINAGHLGGLVTVEAAFGALLDNVGNLALKRSVGASSSPCHSLRAAKKPDQNKAG